MKDLNELIETIEKTWEVYTAVYGEGRLLGYSLNRDNTITFTFQEEYSYYDVDYSDRIQLGISLDDLKAIKKKAHEEYLKVLREKEKKTEAHEYAKYLELKEKFKDRDEKENEEN